MSVDAMPAGLTQWLPVFLATESTTEHVDQWVDRTTAAIANDVAEVLRFDSLLARLEDAVREHWQAFLAAFANPQSTYHLVPGGERLATEVARLQLPLETLVRFYRIAQQSTWSYITNLVHGLPPDQFDHAEVLIYFWDRAARWIDLSINASIEVYQAERSKVLAGAAARLFETVRAVLDGQMDDVRLISSALGGYPITARHTALMLSCSDDTDTASLEPIARELARAVGAGHPLIVPVGGRRLWAWCATQGQPDPDLLACAFAKTDRGSVTVGVGTTSEGIRGFIDSLKDAEDAGRMTAGSGRSAELVAFKDVEVLVLLGCTTKVDRFVRRTLGALLADDEGTQRIRETVETYLVCGGSADEAARALTVHRNTIRYRLGQAEELLGRPIARASTELELALRHRRAFHSDGSRPLDK